MARGADWVDEDDEGAARGVRADAWRLSLQGHVTATGAPPEWCDELGNEPVLAARELVEDNLPLLAPVPQPGDNPVVGMPVLVQLGRQPRVELFGESVTVLGQTFPVRATATATTTIEWGDGAIDDGIERRGATYQQVDGDLDDPRLISHVFQDVGTYEVTVIDRWQGEVTVAGLGTFPFSTQLGETMTLQLGERQAVVTSG